MQNLGFCCVIALFSWYKLLAVFAVHASVLNAHAFMCPATVSVLITVMAATCLRVSPGLTYTLRAHGALIELWIVLCCRSQHCAVGRCDKWAWHAASGP